MEEHGSTPVGRPHQDNSIPLRRPSAREKSGLIAIPDLFSLLYQFRKLQRIRLPWVDFTPVGISDGLNDLGDLMCISGIEVGKNQSFFQAVHIPLLRLSEQRLGQRWP